MKSEKRANKMIFELVDNTRMNECNESCKMEKRWFGVSECSEVLSIESYWIMCKEFAKSLGFAEDTVEEWFGKY